MDLNERKTVRMFASRKTGMIICPECSRKIYFVLPLAGAKPFRRGCKDECGARYMISAEPHSAYCEIEMIRRPSGSGAPAPAQPSDPDPDRTLREIEGLKAAMAGLLDRIESQPKAAAPVPVIKIELREREEIEVDLNDRHAQYEEVLASLLSCGKVILVGPPGSGKSSLARQISDDLGRTFGMQSCTEGMSEAKLVGSMNVQGDYLRSDFVAAFEGSGRFAEKGALFCFDEIDAADPNATLVINEALSNGHLNVPSRRDDPICKRDSRLLVVACANTYGTGSDPSYSGRNQLDGAFLDRFVGLFIHLDYDQKREAAIAKAYGIERLSQVLWDMRKNVTEGKVRRPISTRAFIHLGQLAQAMPGKWTYAKLIDRLLAGWAPAEREKALYGIRIPMGIVGAEGHDDPAPQENPELHPVHNVITEAGAPSCPKCSSPMIRRVAKRGRKAGHSFWGCSRFGDGCRGTINID
jgi:MoxR-like ATPase